MNVPPEIRAIERPHPRLWKVYIVRILASGPLFVITLPLLYFRYHTLRYKFDDEGIHMRWGILFRREVNLTYARIQDIHLTSGPVQRWLKLSDVHIQTAAGAATAEMKIEGLLEYPLLRDFLYSRMRGNRAQGEGAQTATADSGLGDAQLLAAELQAVTEELRGARLALEQLARKDEGDV